MANIPLKSIKFPGLSDTYTIPQIDNTLTQEGQAAGAKETGDKITGLKEDFNGIITLESGSYNMTTGEKYASYARIRNANLIPVTVVSGIKLPTGYSMNIIEYGSDGTTVLDTVTDWVEHFSFYDNYPVQKPYFISIIIRKTASPNADIRSDITTLQNAIVAESASVEAFPSRLPATGDNKFIIANQLGAVVQSPDSVELYRDGFSVYNSDNIIQGSYNRYGAVVKNNARIRSKDYIYFQKGDSVHFVPGTNATEMLYGLFDEDKTFISDSNWYSAETTITFETNSYIIAVFRNSSNTAIIPDEYDAVLQIETELYRFARSVGDKTGIIALNEDIIPMINGASVYGHNGNGLSNIGKLYTLLVVTDTHGDYIRTGRAVDYSNKMPQIDAMIHLGDIVGANFNSPYEWFRKVVQESNKPFYICLGNHDGGDVATDTSKGATVQQQFDRFIQPNLDKIGIQSLSTPWYAINDTTHKITIIILDCYDLPDTLSDGEFVVRRNTPGYSQAQINWLISTLANVPTDHHVLIAQHCIFEAVTPDTNEWRNPQWSYVAAPSVIDAYDYKGMLMEIVEAWKSGDTLTKTYTATMEGMPNLTVSANFTSRGTGVFVGYLIGHTHWDQTGVVTAFPTQHYYNLDTTANDLSQNKWSDLSRQLGTKCEDCITTVSIDTVNRRVKMVRVGSNQTFNLTSRQKVIIEY